MKKTATVLILMLISIFPLTAQDCEAWFYSEADSQNQRQISFFDGSTPQVLINSWTWQFGDGFNSSEQNPVHTYIEDGEYFVMLIITTQQCTDTLIQIIEVEDNLSFCFTDFSFIPDDLNQLEINFFGFYDSDDINGLLWNWDFGDGTTSTEQNPVHVFATDSAYNISLLVDNGTCSDSVTKNVPVGDYSFGDDCIAMFSYSVLDPAGLIFEFYDESWAGLDTTYDLIWDFGDGFTSSDLYPIHAYQTEGRYVVSLLISTQNCSNSISFSVYAGEDVWYPNDCQSMFYFEQDEQNAYQMQFFDASLFSGNDNFWFWDFGDGNYSYLQNPVHVFSAEGYYDITLEINSDSCLSVFTMELMIFEDSTYSQGLEALFYPEFLDENTVKFHNLSSGNITDLRWDFDDGHYSFDHDPTHDFDEVGIHEIALSVRNDDGANTTIITIDNAVKSSKNILYSVSFPGGTFSSVQELENTQLSIYPNPVADFLSIELHDKSDFNIQIFNSLGQILMSDQVNNQKNTINVSALPAGVYFIKIYSGKSIKTATFIKK